MSNICFNLNNTIEISDNLYIFNNDKSIIGDLETNISTYYGLYKTDEEVFYSIKNVPKTHPIGFYDASGISEIVDISNLIDYNVSYGKAINIYVSKGSDLSFNNNNYYRFYDECYNLLNISTSLIETGLTNSGDNFYFMRSMEYTFIAIEDFCSNHPFALSGEALSGLNYDDLSLQKLDDSFNITIPKNTNNDTNRIFYVDAEQDDISGELSILVDASNISYYYGDIKISIDSSYSTHYDSSKISIKSFPLDGINQVNNVNLFGYDIVCDYIPEDAYGYFNRLADSSTECLNIVSEAKRIENLVGNKYHYEFNLNNHGTRQDENNDNIDYSIYKYGVYNGRYTIFNVDRNLPIRLINDDINDYIKDCIYIDETASSNQIQSNGQIYYYNKVVIHVNNRDGKLFQNKNIQIRVLDILATPIIEYEISNNFIYTSFCNDSDTVNNITGSLEFKLYNQINKPYTHNYTQNIFNINLYEGFIELTTPYKAVDRYNHDISNLITTTAPRDINYGLQNYIITYTLKDYEENIIFLYRLVQINTGPFIEVNYKDYLFQNSNPYTNIINIPTNIINPSNNFYKNLDVYIYNDIQEKISIPFKITLSGEYYDLTSTNDAVSRQNISSDILIYNNTEGSPFKIQVSEIIDISLNYYLSNNFSAKLYTGSKKKLDENGILIKNIKGNTITTVNVADGDTNILNMSLLTVDDNDLGEDDNDGPIGNAYNTFITQSGKDSINKLRLRGDEVTINKIDNYENVIDISLVYRVKYGELNFDASLTITNTYFKLNIDCTNNNSKVTIDGSFEEIDFFTPNNIDPKYIGNYELTVSALGLSSEDFIFNDISDVIADTNLIIDISRTFFINIHDDNISPEINFKNNNQTNSSYELIYPNYLKFHVINDISFFKTGDLFIENTNTPLLEFSDNSIYNGFLTAEVSGHINTTYTDSVIEVDILNLGNETSADISYTAFDLCGNSSNPATLKIIFKDIPLLQLDGSTNEVISLNYNEYIENGITITYQDVSVNFKPDSSEYDLTSETTAANTAVLGAYDISWTLNLDTSVASDSYTFIYQVKKRNSDDSVSITRFIQVKDIEKPQLIFPSLSIVDPKTYTTPLESEYSSRSNIDFSLTVHSSFDFLKSVIEEYKSFDEHSSLTATDTSYVLTISGMVVDFNEDKLRNVPVFDSDTNIQYLNADGSFNVVSIGINKYEPLKFEYTVTDTTGNTYSQIRTVDIIDIENPTISFTKVESEFIEYSNLNNDYKDFSYQAFNYEKNEEDFLNELSSIIFETFSLHDNFHIDSDNFEISISGITIDYKKTNILTISDIKYDVSCMELFSKPENQLIIIYDISDNQYNYATINRYVDIINTTKPKIDFINNTNILEISFGNLNHDISSNFTLYHDRMLTADLNIDISYILPNKITSLVGFHDYDPSALIYSAVNYTPSTDNVIKFYSTIEQGSYYLTSDTIDITITITNEGPIFDGLYTLYTLENPHVTLHEAAEILTDASLILYVNVTSEYDKFYYYNYFPDISYLSTNYDINFKSVQDGIVETPELNQENPRIGIYKIIYTATDKNGQRTILERIIQVVDTNGPIITISYETIEVDQFEELIMPSAFFTDKGTYLRDISISLYEILIDNDTPVFIKLLTYKDLTPSFPNPYLDSYDFSSSELLLTTNDTSNSSVSYTVLYQARDISQISTDICLNISIKHITNFVFAPKISIFENVIELDKNFNYNFNNLITNNNNLGSIFDISDLTYDIITKTITYEANNLRYHTDFSFTMHARYNNNVIPSNQHTITNNAFESNNSNKLGVYVITFTALVTRLQSETYLDTYTETINFNRIDTTPPVLSFISSIDHTDIYNIKLPLMSELTLLESMENIKNKNLFNPYYLTSDVYGSTIFSIPGINIFDAINGTTQTLSNETMPLDADPEFRLYISYKKILPSQNGSDVLPKSFPSISSLTTTININSNLQDTMINVFFIYNSDINSNTNNYAEIVFYYPLDIVHTFKHNGNNMIEYQSNGDTNTTVINRSLQRNEISIINGSITTKYLIENVVNINENSWNFRALNVNNNIEKIDLRVAVGSDSDSDSISAVEITEIPNFDISAAYLTLNAGNYVQNFKLYDSRGNFSDISRSLIVERFDPFINLTYERDVKANEFLKFYFNRHNNYIDRGGSVIDYYHGVVDRITLKMLNDIDKTELGVQIVRIQMSVTFTDNTNTITYTPTADREVHVVDSKCLPGVINGLNELKRKNVDYKWGLYNAVYTINISDEADAIRVFGNNVDITDIISITGENVITHNNNEYHWGEIVLSVTDDFNRASVEYLDLSKNPILLEDIFLWTTECNIVLINELRNIQLPEDTFRVDVSGYNEVSENTVSDLSKQFFILTGEIYPSLEDVNRRNITELPKPILHLAMGRYKFIQDTEKNFYNRIKFSITEDGTHNGGIEYTKGIIEYSLPGLTDGYTELILSATTPTPLYYYSEHFPNMGARIETRNNLVISNANIYISDNVLSVDNSSVLHTIHNNEKLLNKIFLSQTFDLSGINGNDISHNNVHINCITQQNINHNIIINKNEKLLMFKKYQHSPNYDPVTNQGIDHVPQYADTPDSQISNENIKHDISNHYLYDFSVNMQQTYVFQYDYTIDTEANLLSNLSTNILVENMLVAVGCGIENTMGYSIDNGINWIGLGKVLLDSSGLGIGYDDMSRFIAVGSGINDTIIYSNNGIDWIPTNNSKVILDDYAKAIVYDNSNTLWLVGGKGSINNLAYSNTGIMWIGLGKTLFDIEINSFSKHNNTYILAFGNDSNSNSIAYSSDGKTWIPGEGEGGNTKDTIFSVQGNGGVYYNKENIWIAVGEGVDNTIAYSNNGINWIGLGKLNIIEGRDVAVNDNMAIIVGKGNISNGKSAIIYSFNGLDWFSSETTIFSECNSIAWNGSTWIASGLGELDRIAVSSDGIKWTGLGAESINLFSQVAMGTVGFSKKTFLRNTNDILYNLDILNLFYSNSEIDNYSNFFRKNRLLTGRLVTKNFISRINELTYINHVSLLEDNKTYDYFLDKYLNSNMITFNHIFDNLITFNLQTYIDLSNYNIDKNLLNFLHKEHFPLYDTGSNFLTDKNNLLFDEFIVNIWSDISGTIPTIIKDPEQSILFSNGLIELNEYLIDSEDSSGILYKLYENITNSRGIEYVNNELENRVFLSVRDTQMIGHEYNKFIGITQENIFHNMYLDEENVLIFHSHQDTGNNYKVNEPNLSLEKTLRDFSNNNKYLLEISTNDIYGCFVGDEKNIKNNANTKNDVIEQDTPSYKTFITYFLDNELSNTDNYLTQFDIRPIALNNIDYNLYPYTYHDELKNLHSHSYVINLNDYFERYIYDNPNLDVPWNMYNKSYLSYTLKDINFLKDLNIYDIRADQNIIIDKSKIEILNYLQDFLKIIHFKLKYIDIIINNDLIYKHVHNDYLSSNNKLLNNFTIQNMNELYNSFEFISINYQLTLPNASLNKLSANIFYNLKQIKNKYSMIEEIFIYHQDDKHIRLNINEYYGITNFDKIDQLHTDAKSINTTIDNFVYNNLYYYYNGKNIETIIKLSEHSFLSQYSDLDILHQLLNNFRQMKQNYDKTLNELKIREANYNQIDLVVTDLYDITDIDLFIASLLNNYSALDTALREQITVSGQSNTYIYISTTNHLHATDNCHNSFDPGFEYIDINGITDKSIIDISININHVINNYNYFINAYSNVYDYLDKTIIYDSINYHMSGSELLINSFYSNNVKMKFEIKYNSYLYPDKYVDTIVLDIAIPDYTPPTLIFNNTDLSFSQALSTSSDINTLLDILINDISFIELNQSYDITNDLTNIRYNDVSYSSFQTSELENNIYSTIEIDVTNLYNSNTTFLGDDASINILYTVIDNANNKNIIERTVNVERAFDYPLFYFRDPLSLTNLTIQEFLASLESSWSFTIQEGTIYNNELKDMLIENIIASDPAAGTDPLTNEPYEIPVNVEINLTDINTPGVYENAIVYSATSNKGFGITTRLERDLIITVKPIVIDVSDEVIPTNPFGPCKCPVYYKPIQHNYKLGSGASNIMRISRILLRK